MTEDSRLILQLENIQTHDMLQHGGKAANLVRLHHAGFRVPKGFSISSHYFACMISDIPEMREIIRQLDRCEDYEDILEGGTVLQILARKYELPEDLKSQIAKELHSLKGRVGPIVPGYAVRSSATVEDGEHISFAGQAESFLCVGGIERVLKSVKSTWRSTLSPGALIYLKSKGVSIGDVKMGVVVQEMVPADIAGVMFTANVVTNDRNQVLIEATWGLGELLVAGKITPDTYLVDKHSLDIVEKRLGTKELTSAPTGVGENVHITRFETPEEKRQIYTFSEEALQSVVQVGLEIEDKMGCPQDIEWCTRDGEIIILQTRPITSLGEA